MQPRPETKDGAINPIGLYKDPQSGQTIGAIEEIQADAIVHLGFKLVEEGREAAMLSEKEIAEKYSDAPTEVKAVDKSSKKESK